MTPQTYPLPESEARRIAAEYDARIPTGIEVKIYSYGQRAEWDAPALSRKASRANQKRRDEALKTRTKVMRLHAQGLTDAEIGTALMIHPQSVGFIRRKAIRESNGATG